MTKINIYKPSIFNGLPVNAGVTESNFHLFEKGFSIFPGKILNNEEVENFRNILAINIGKSKENLKYQKQVHGNTIRIIDENSSDTEESDGMITNVKGLVLNLTLADCCGILVYDPKQRAIGAFHSGWKGTKNNIAEKGIQAMMEAYSSTPEELIIFLSPCAGAERYEVGEDVAKYFPMNVKKKIGEKYLLNLRLRIKQQLLACGVKEHNIETSGFCTIRDRRFHSYRRDGDNSGRMSAFISFI